MISTLANVNANLLTLASNDNHMRINLISELTNQYNDWIHRETRELHGSLLDRLVVQRGNKWQHATYGLCRKCKCKPLWYQSKDARDSQIKWKKNRPDEIYACIWIELKVNFFQINTRVKPCVSLRVSCWPVARHISFPCSP